MFSLRQTANHLSSSASSLSGAILDHGSAGVGLPCLEDHGRSQIRSGTPPLPAARALQPGEAPSCQTEGRKKGRAVRGYVHDETLPSQQTLASIARWPVGLPDLKLIWMLRDCGFWFVINVQKFLKTCFHFFITGFLSVDWWAKMGNLIHLKWNLQHDKVCKKWRAVNTFWSHWKSALAHSRLETIRTMNNTFAGWPSQQCSAFLPRANEDTRADSCNWALFSGALDSSGRNPFVSAWGCSEPAYFSHRSLTRAFHCQPPIRVNEAAAVR